MMHACLAMAGAVARQIRPQLVRSALACTALACSGCAALDPMLRRGEWHPAGSNRLDLAQMVADPRDLAHGRGDGPGDAGLAAAAVLRLRAGKVKPLPDTGLAELRLQSAGDNAAAGGN